MVSARRGTVRIFALTAFACVVFRMAAADQPAPGPAVEPPKPPAGTVPVAGEPAAPWLRTIHRQVTRLPLAREYRPVPVGDVAEVAAHEKIRAALKRPLAEELNFTETPLRDVIKSLHEILEVPVVVDRRAFENAGLDLDATVVTFTGEGTTARAALRQILRDFDLAWVIRDEAIVITTKDDAAEIEEIRLYPLPLSYATQGAGDLLSLIDLVENTAAPQTWNTVGGEGSIQPFGDGAATLLLVRQTADGHEEVEGVLRGLHERDLAEFAPVEDAPDARTPTLRVYHVADEAARADLEEKLVELCNVSLQHGADPEARVTIVGDCLAVHATTPEFHALAGQLIRAVAGEQVTDGWPQGMGGMGGGGANGMVPAGAGGIF